MEQERFKRRLMATARSLKKKEQQLQADQDLLTERCTKVLAAEEYGLKCHTKGYPKHKWLPQLEEEPILPAQDEADRPPCGRDKMAYQPEYQPAPPRHYTTARGNRQDLQYILENKAGQPRSIYGSWGRAPTCKDDRYAGYTIDKPGGPNTADRTQSNCVAT